MAPVTAKRHYSASSFQIYNISDSSINGEAAPDVCMIDSNTFVDLISNNIDDAKNADSDKFAYAVGDYLRLPKLYGAEGFDTEKLTNETMRNWSGYLYPESIVHSYYKAATIECGAEEAKIMPELLRKTVGHYLDALPDKFELRKIFLDEEVVLVHLRIGDIGHLNDSILNKLQELKLFNPRFIVIAGVHSAWMHSSMAWGMKESDAKYRAYENARFAFKQLHQYIGSFDWLVCDPDLALCAAYLSKKLFVHRGGFSAALGLVANGKIYVTNELEHFQRWEVKKWPTWEMSLSKDSRLEFL